MQKLFLIVLFMAVATAGCKTDDSKSIELVMPKFDCSTVATTSQSLTQIDTSATPRVNAAAEILALEASGEFIAPEALYQRVDAELTTIRATYPQVASLDAIFCSPMSITVSMDDNSYAAAEAGNYTDWDGLNQNLRVNDQTFLDSIKAVGLEFDGRYDMLRVSEAYAALPGVIEARPSTYVFAENPDSDVCLAVRDDKHYFIFASIDSSFAATNYIYYGFETDSSGNIRGLGNYDTSTQAPEPQWYTALADCRAYLIVMIT